jgi:rhodanese-related sulfurtransferase
MYNMAELLAQQDVQLERLAQQTKQQKYQQQQQQKLQPHQQQQQQTQPEQQPQPKLQLQAQQLVQPQPQQQVKLHLQLQAQQNALPQHQPQLQLLQQAQAQAQMKLQAVQSQQHTHQAHKLLQVGPSGAPEAIQQHADSYALQQGLQFAAQMSSPSKDQLQHPEIVTAREETAAKSRFAELPNTVPLAAGVERLDPRVVHELLKKGGCVLVDVRGDDRAVGTITGAINVKAVDTVPFASKVPDLLQQCRNQPLIVFHCQYSAHRAPTCANTYRQHADNKQRVAIMDGGFRGWESSGLPVFR